MNQRKNISPKIWGNHFWNTMFSTAFTFPDEPDTYQKETYKKFFLSFEEVLPCETCRVNFKKHLNIYPIDDFLSNPDDLFQWVLNMRNLVLKVQGRPEMKLNDAINTYILKSEGMSDKMKIVLVLTGIVIGVALLKYNKVI